MLKAWCVLISASLPKTPFPVKGCVCLVGFASLQSPLAYTPGIHAGAECGAAALTKQGRLQSATQSHYARTHNDSHTKPLHDATAQMAVNAQMQRHQRLTNRIGATPKARTLWLLAKSYKQGRLCQLFVPLHDATAQTADFAEMQNQHSKQR